ncbi:hypothetical protein UlMin_009942 [Ulmus minor]
MDPGIVLSHDPISVGHYARFRLRRLFLDFSICHCFPSSVTLNRTSATKKGRIDSNFCGASLIKDSHAMGRGAWTTPWGTRPIWPVLDAVVNSKQGTKAGREKLRRERLNDRFMDLSSVLEPGRPMKTDKPAILDDAIRVINQLKNEAQELKETNEKLIEEIKSLKVEKNELREEKLVLKADKEKMEQQLKAMSISPSGFMPAHPAAYQNKMAVYPSYGLYPMWHYLPQSTRDTSRDHELRPPAA